jgi:hypothetical protein
MFLTTPEEVDAVVTVPFTTLTAPIAEGVIPKLAGFSCGLPKASHCPVEMS